MMTVFKTYTPLSTFLGLYNSSFHKLVMHCTNLWSCHTTKDKYMYMCNKVYIILSYITGVEIKV